MAETIDEARVIAWIDGELPPEEAAWMAHAVAADPGLAALADRHRRMKARFADGFAPLAAAPEPAHRQEPAPVISLAAVRAERDAKAKAKARTRVDARPDPVGRWTIPAMVAASLIVGILSGYGIGSPSGVADRPGALAVSPKIASALDGQLSGDAGTIRVALTFRDSAGDYCRSFTATHLSGVACRQAGAWQLRYASAAAPAAQGDYRMAGSDGAATQVIAAMIAGDPLDRATETAARDKGWR